MKNESRIDRLKKFTLFSELTDDELRAIEELMEERFFTAGYTIFLEGEKGNRVYFLKSGKVKAIKSTPEGDEQILEIIQAGDVFGEVVLFGIEEYPATAIAMEDVRADCLSQDSFRRHFEQNPQLGWGMLKVMAKKLYRAQHKIKNLGLHDTKGRVASLIVDMLNDFGDLATQQVVLDINRQEMSDYIGTTRETVSRTLSEFRSDGLITIEGNRISVRDLTRLKEYIE